LIYNTMITDTTIKVLFNYLSFILMYINICTLALIYSNTPHAEPQVNIDFIFLCIIFNLHNIQMFCCFSWTWEKCPRFCCLSSHWCRYFIIVVTASKCHGIINLMFLLTRCNKRQCPMILLQLILFSADYC
jgi:hypothetical protein